MFVTGVFPEALKKALVKTIYKKVGVVEFNNYRKISKFLEARYVTNKMVLVRKSPQ